MGGGGGGVAVLEYQAEWQLLKKKEKKGGAPVVRHRAHVPAQSSIPQVKICRAPAIVRRGVVCDSEGEQGRGEGREHLTPQASKKFPRRSNGALQVWAWS